MSDKISVPRELLEEMLQAMQPIYSLPPKYYGSTLGDRVRALLAQPNTCTKDGGQCGLGGYCEPYRSVEPKCTSISGDGLKEAAETLERIEKSIAERADRLGLTCQPEPVCTCPSGDGSLRWPCPVHPPEPVAWRIFNGEGGFDFTEDDEFYQHWLATNGPGYASWCEPLYRHPPAQPSDGALTNDIKRDQSYRDGVRRGWRFCQDGDDAGYRQCIKQLNYGILEARATIAAVHAPAQAPVVLPDGWEEKVMADIEHRQNLCRMRDDYSLPFDDTQLGAEAACQVIKALLADAKRLNTGTKS